MLFRALNFGLFERKEYRKDITIIQLPFMNVCIARRHRRERRGHTTVLPDMGNDAPRLLAPDVQKVQPMLTRVLVKDYSWLLHRGSARAHPRVVWILWSEQLIADMRSLPLCSFPL